jgi:hypothetical protein
LRDNAKSSKLLFWVQNERSSVITGILSIDIYVFRIEDYGEGRNIYNNRVCVKGSTSNGFEVDYYGKLEEVIKLQYHRVQNTICLFKGYLYDTGKGIRVDHHHRLVKINKRGRLSNINDVFVCQTMSTSVIHIHSFL